MATGLPDYYRGIDVAYQALAQLTNRPMYGGAQRAVSVASATANDNRLFLEVLGKGMIYGGHLHTDPAASQKTGVPDIVVDGKSLSRYDFETMDSLGFVIAMCKPIILTKYDDTNFLYCVTFLYGITFEESCSLWYTENEGNTPQVRTELIYAII